jgi:hypothetical protein
MTRFYDPNGNYVAYCGDFRHLYDQFGKYIGYFLNNSLFNIQGETIGFVKDRAVYNSKGQQLYFAR